MKREQAINGLYACPCCGYATLSEVGCFEICDLYFWEDDGQDESYQDENWGGPNKLSLIDGRINFLTHGVSDLKDIRHVRKSS